MYWKIMVGVIAVIAILIFMEVYRELHSFCVVTYKVSSPKLKGIGGTRKLLFLSDLHNRTYGKDNEELIWKVRQIQPDLVLIGGDMLVGKEGVPYETACKTVKEIAKYVPVFYANGNHEQRMKEEPERYAHSYKEYQRRLQQAGVRFLENDSMEFLFEEGKVNITGLEIPIRCYAHFHKENLAAEELEERIGRPDEKVYQILMAHNPSYADSYLKWGADLVLSGHLHGGIVRIPGIAGVISPAFDLFPKYSGDHYKEGKKDIIVSKGLGVHTICVRLFNPAELVVIELSEES